MALSFTGSYPASFGLFTAVFQQSAIPAVATDLHGFFIQHKFDDQVSHISSGYWYNSVIHSKVRLDETYAGAFGSSLFDYTNTSCNGAVSNHQVITSPAVGSEATCFNDYVDKPGFPLITADFLQSNNAIFGGILEEPFLGETQTWNFLLANTISVVAYLNNASPPILLGYDFWAPERRTKVVTRFFAHQAGNISADVFEDFPC